MEGTCGEFIISIEDEKEGCWDVKIESPGQILDKTEWKDSFFYSANAFCDGKGEIQFRTGSIEKEINGVIKLRQNSTINEEQFTITQSCENSYNMLFITAFVIIFILAISVMILRK